MSRLRGVARAVFVFVAGFVVILAPSGGCCSSSGGEARSYIRIHDPSFDDRVIYDVTEAVVDGTPTLVAVGTDGSWTSTDGTNWSFHGGPPKSRVLARGENIFATGNGNLYHSADGQSWTQVQLGTSKVNDVTVAGGGFLAVGQGFFSPNQVWVAAVWTSADGTTWERHLLPTSSSFPEVTAAVQGLDTPLVAGGFSGLTSTSRRTRFWYFEDNGGTWSEGSGPFTSSTGAVGRIVVGENNVFYAVSGVDTLWRSADGKSWEVVDDPEVHATGERFGFSDHQAIGQSNVTLVIGSRAGTPTVWEFVRSYNRWERLDATSIFGAEMPTTLTGIGYSPSIARSWVFTGVRTVNGTDTGAIWLRAPN